MARDSCCKIILLFLTALLPSISFIDFWSRINNYNLVPPWKYLNFFETLYYINSIVIFPCTIYLIIIGYIIYSITTNDKDDIYSNQVWNIIAFISYFSQITFFYMISLINYTPIIKTCWFGNNECVKNKCLYTEQGIVCEMDDRVPKYWEYSQILYHLGIIYYIPVLIGGFPHKDLNNFFKKMDLLLWNLDIDKMRLCHLMVSKLEIFKLGLSDKYNGFCLDNKYTKTIVKFLRLEIPKEPSVGILILSRMFLPIAYLGYITFLLVGLVFGLLWNMIRVILSISLMVVPLIIDCNIYILLVSYSAIAYLCVMCKLNFVYNKLIQGFMHLKIYAKKFSFCPYSCAFLVYNNSNPKEVRYEINGSRSRSPRYPNSIIRSSDFMLPLMHRSAVQGLKIQDEEIKDWTCQICLDLMLNPYSTCHGHTYDLECIQEWFDQGNKTDPCTNSELENKKLTPNFSVRAAISSFLDEKQRHSSIPSAPPLAVEGGGVFSMV